MDGDAGRRRVLLSALVVVAGVAAGCASGSGTAPAPSAPPPSAPAAPAPSPAEVAGQEALVAYRGMWADFVAAGATSDWRSRDLGRHAAGVALTNLSRGLYADSVNGLVTRGEPTLSPVVSSVEPAGYPTRVVVTDCGDSTNSLKHRADDGSAVSQGSGGRRLINAVVERQSDGSWKVSDFGVQEIGSC